MSSGNRPDDLFSEIDALERRLQSLERNSSGIYLPSASIAGVGISGNRRAGRKLKVADFTALLGISAPIALYNLDTNNDSSGNARNLTPTTGNGVQPSLGPGITAAANEATRFGGNNLAGLFIADASGGPFNFRTGSFGCWFKTAKTGASQRLLSKGANIAGRRSWHLSTDQSSGSLKVLASTDGNNAITPIGVTNVHDDRWHFGVGTYDGTLAKVYCDANLEAVGRVGGDLFQVAEPFNIGNGGISAAAGTGSENLPMFGLIDEAFVCAEVLNEDQIRLLMAASIPHGLGSIPTSPQVKVRRRRRGRAFVDADFPATPRRLYNFTWAGGQQLTDAGADGVNIGVSGSVTAAAGMDGSPNEAMSFPGPTGNMLGCAAPAAFTAAQRTVGCWFQTLGNGGAQMTLVSLSGGTATDWRPLYIQASGVPSTWDGTGVTPPFIGQSVTDGLPHFWVVVWDSNPNNNPSDGLKRKAYLDGQLFASDTSFTTPTIGTGQLWVGQLGNGTEPYKGLLDGLFVCDYAMTPEQIQSLYSVGSKQLPAAMFDNSIVEGADDTNLYLLADKLDPQHLLDIKVAA